MALVLPLKPENAEVRLDSKAWTPSVDLTCQDGRCSLSKPIEYSNWNPYKGLEEILYCPNVLQPAFGVKDCTEDVYSFFGVIKQELIMLRGICCQVYCNPK